MKNIRSIFYIGIALALFSSACSPSDKYKAEIKQLDSLSLLLDSTELKFEAVDTMKMYKYRREIETNLDFIEKNNRDTLSRDEVFLISDYSMLRDPLKKINHECAEIAEELEESKEQIGDLIHDFKIDKVEKEKASFYLQDEVIAASRVIRNVEIVTTLSKLNFEKFEASNPKVLNFVEKIKSKQARIIK